MHGSGIRASIVDLLLGSSTCVGRLWAASNYATMSHRKADLPRGSRAASRLGNHLSHSPPDCSGNCTSSSWPASGRNWVGGRRHADGSEARPAGAHLQRCRWGCTTTAVARREIVCSTSSLRDGLATSSGHLPRGDAGRFGALQRQRRPPCERRRPASEG